MRKLGIVLAALACLSLMAIPAMAAKGDFTFGFNGGMTIPTGDFGKTDVATGTYGFTAGFGGGVFGDYQIHEMVAVGVDAAYSQNSGKDWPADFDAKVTFMQFGGHVKFMPQMKDTPLSPYLQVGAGLYNGKTEVSYIGFAADTTVNKFGFNVGVGADYKVSPQMALGVFGAYHNIMSAYVDNLGDEQAANYIAVGVKLTFMTTGTTK